MIRTIKSRFWWRSEVTTKEEMEVSTMLSDKLRAVVSDDVSWVDVILDAFGVCRVISNTQ